MNCNMSAANILLVLILFITYISDVICHGGMVEPPMRSIMWRYGFDNPINYDWNSLYCGGFHNFQQHGGKCGLCGDPVQGPYENDRGGEFDNGIIVRHYPVGLREIEVKIEITAHHKGFFTFKLCPNNEGPLTADCLNRYPLKIRESNGDGNPLRYYPPPSPNLNELHVLLPPDVTCDRCVLQWTYTAGNSDGLDPSTRRRCIGCGLQETFVNCADISIGGTVDQIPVSKHHHGPSSAGAEIVIPSTVDITDAIANASPDTTFHDIMRDTGIWRPEPPPQEPIPAINPSRPGTIGIRSNPNVPAPNVPVPASPRATNGRFVRLPVRNQLSPISNIGSTNDVHARARPAINPMDQNRQVSSRIDFDMRNLNMNNMNVHNTPTGVRHTGSPQSGYHIPLLHVDSLDLLINEIHRANPNAESVAQFHMRQSEWEMRRREQELYDMRMREMMQRGRQTRTMRQNDVGLPVSLNLRAALQANVPIPRSDGMTSYRAAVRPVSRLPAAPYATQTRSVSEIIPDLSNNAGPPYIITSRSENPRSRQPSLTENWFPDAQRRVMDSQVRGGFSNRSAGSRLPRRIVVHSMSVAQHLLQKYPYLRGRVFLSQQAHVRNKYTHATHKYARRPRW